MRIGTVLLSTDGYYVGMNGELPTRNAWDKEFITNLAKGASIVCSANTAKALPPSIKKVAAKINIDFASVYDINFGIATFRTQPPDMMIICKSPAPLNNGKPFDMVWLNTNYILSIPTTEVDIWLHR